MKKLYIDLDKTEVEKTLLKQQLAKQLMDAHTQSDISFPISGQSEVHVCYNPYHKKTSHEIQQQHTICFTCLTL